MTDSEVVSIVYDELLKVAGGATVLLAALSAFLGKIWITRIANAEAAVREQKLEELRASFARENGELKARLDAALQRTVLVDKIRFEHEYAIYRKAWVTLEALRKATGGLRPVFGNVDLSESKDDERKRKVANFNTALTEFRGAIENEKPFYSQDVYQTLTELLVKCWDEGVDYDYTQRNPKEYWQEAKKNHEAILLAIEKVGEAIRARLAEVRIV